MSLHNLNNFIATRQQCGLCGFQMKLELAGGTRIQTLRFKLKLGHFHHHYYHMFSNNWKMPKIWSRASLTVIFFSWGTKQKRDWERSTKYGARFFTNTSINNRQILTREVSGNSSCKRTSQLCGCVLARCLWPSMSLALSAPTSRSSFPRT